MLTVKCPRLDWHQHKVGKQGSSLRGLWVPASNTACGKEVWQGVERKPWVRSNMQVFWNLPTLKPVLFWHHYLL